MVLLEVRSGGSGSSGAGGAARERRQGLQQLAHMSTPTRIALGLKAFAGIDVDNSVLKATELRLAGNAAARAGELREAAALYTEVSEPADAWLCSGLRSRAC